MSVRFALRSVLWSSMLGCACAGLADGAHAPSRRSSLPLVFEQNTGRYDPRVAFVARVGGGTAFITPSEMVLAMPGGGADRSAVHVLRMRLVGADAGAVASGVEKQPGVVNYFIGADPTRWRTRAPTYARAKVAGVYPGVDLVYYGASRDVVGAGRAGAMHAGARRLGATRELPLRLEYDFVLKPGADPRRIRLAFEGADRIRVAGGDLALSTPAGEVRLRRPYAYQSVGGKRVQVACDYRLGGRSASLRLARYDTRRPLIVDPVVLVYSTYFGGMGDENAHSIAVDGSGAAIIAGVTHSADLPTTAGAYDTALSIAPDAFVAKLNPAGTALVWSTYIGGSDADYGVSVATDASGAGILCGRTASWDFPTTPGAFDRTKDGGSEAFVTRVNAAGDVLGFSTYLGGSGDDLANAIAAEPGGTVWVAGQTGSPEFPTTPGAFDNVLTSANDAFVTKLASSGNVLLYSTYLGGTHDDSANGIAVDGQGAAFVVGETMAADFPTTAGAYDRTHNGGADAFVTKLSPDGSSPAWSTYLGGSSDDYGRALALDGSGGVIVCGSTGSSGFPTTPGAHDRALGGPSDAFVARLSAAGDALAYSTYLGGSADDSPRGLAADPAGNAVVVGATASADFPVTSDAMAVAHNGNIDAFLTLLNPAGTGLTTSTFFGGAASDYGACVAPFGGSLYMCGYTTSVDLPTTAGALDTSANGAVDAFVAKLDPTAPVGTSLWAGSRTGIISEPVTLRQYDLRRTTDNLLLSHKAITFKIDGTAVGVAQTDAGGDAWLNWGIPEGPTTRTITTEFEGDSAYLPSSADGALTCRFWQTKMAPFDRTARITDRTELKARLVRSDNVPIYGKAINFNVDGTFVITRSTNVEGYASFPYYDVPDGAGAGNRTIFSEWLGNGGYAAISKTSTLTVLKAIPHIWVLSKSVPKGGIANLYAYFRRLYDYKKQEGKAVTFRIDGTWIADVTTGSGAEAGVARYLHPTGGLGVGAHTIRCEFAGDAWVDAGFGQGTLTIL